MKQWFVGLFLGAFSHLGLELSALAIDVPSVFYVSKNDNGNQIHYGIKLDQNCLHVGKNPLYIYWVRENGSIGELLSMEQSAYCIYSQVVGGKDVNVMLSFFHERGITKLITVQSSQNGNGVCQSQAFTSINGRKSRRSTIDIELTKVLRNPFTGSTIRGTIVNINLVNAKEKEVIPCTSGCRFGI